MSLTPPETDTRFLVQKCGKGTATLTFYGLLRRTGHGQ